MSQSVWPLAAFGTTAVLLHLIGGDLEHQLLAVMMRLMGWIDGRHEAEKREGGGKGNWGTVGDEM